MATQYIIKFIKNDDEEVDGYVELSRDILNIPFISVRTHKNTSDEMNQTLLLKFMTNNFAKVEFNDDNTSCIIKYKDGNSRNTYISTIYFDSNSFSAYSEFKKTFLELYNSKYETEYYPSGRVSYVGEVLYKKGTNDEVIGRVPNGKGVVYYDLPGYKIKYTGEFENGYYDGSGVFYNQDNKISLIAKNISAGIPTQKITLKINYNKKKETIDIQINNLWEKNNITDKIVKRNIAMSDTFVNDLAKTHWTINDIPLECLVFQDKSLDDKYFELWSILNIQNSKTNNYIEYTKTMQKEINNILLINCISIFLIFGYIVLNIKF